MSQKNERMLAVHGSSSLAPVREPDWVADREERKLVRMTILRVLLAMAPLVGGAESIHAISRKEKASA